MKIYITFFLIMLLSTFTYSEELQQDSSWSCLCSKDGKFSIELPTKPKRAHYVKNLYELYRPKDCQAVFPYLIVVVSNPTRVINLEDVSPQQIASWRDTMETQLVWISTLAKLDYTLNDSNFLLIDHCPAIDCELKSKSGEQFFVRMMMVSNRIYFLGAQCGFNSPNGFDSTYERFINSFKVS